MPMKADNQRSIEGRAQGIWPNPRFLDTVQHKWSIVIHYTSHICKPELLPSFRTAKWTMYVILSHFLTCKHHLIWMMQIFSVNSSGLRQLIGYIQGHCWRRAPPSPGWISWLPLNDISLLLCLFFCSRQTLLTKMNLISIAKMKDD